MALVVPRSTTGVTQPIPQQPPPQATSRLIARPAPLIVDAVSGIGSLGLRLRADQITGVTSGSGVSTWPDASGAGNDANQPTDTNQPTFQTAVVNGQPVVRWPTSGIHYLDSPASASDPAQTVVVVAKPSQLPTAFGASMRGATTTGGLELRLTASAPQGRMEMLKEAVASIGLSTTVASTTAFQVFIGTYDSSTGAYAFYRNGTAEGSGTNAQTFTAGALTRVGDMDNAGQESWIGDIAELIVFSKVLSSGERATVDSYVQDLYGITVSDYTGSGGTAASATGSITLDGTAAASATPTATGTITLGGTGTTAAQAAATGSITLGGTGTATAQPTAAGSITLGGTGTWTAQATGSITLAGTATPTAAATAAGSITLGGSATPTATAAGSITLAGTASGRAQPTSAGQITLAGTGTGAGQATAAGSITLGGTGTGTPPGPNAAGSITLAGTATAQAAPTAAGSVTLGGTATASAAPTAAGAIVLGGTGAARAGASSGGSITLAGAAQLSALAQATGQILLSGTAAWQPPFAFDTPPERTYVVAADDRTLVVAADDRTYVVPVENRTVVVGS